MPPRIEEVRNQESMSNSLARTEELPDLVYRGERIIPGKTTEALFAEHEDRYVFAARYVSRKDVLDVACGSGVGTSFLQKAGARDVWGVDIDADAIAFGTARYPDCKLRQCEATDLCLSDSSLDVVVSFETIEHLTDQERFLKECWRVLKPGGTLICSTPNKTMNRWNGHNPFHVRELSPMEFRNLVSSVFGNIELFAQGNRTVLPYIARKILFRVLARLRLFDIVLRVSGRKATAEPLRTEFVNSKSRIREGISPYHSQFLTQPLYMIAVAKKHLT